MTQGDSGSQQGPVALTPQQRTLQGRRKLRPRVVSSGSYRVRWSFVARPLASTESVVLYGDMSSARSYGQFCPVSLSAEILAVRWMPIVLRELLYGSTRFQELRRGIPLISPTMLSQRLHELVDAGLVEHDASAHPGGEYRLTKAGLDMRPIVEQLGAWGQRWMHHRITDDHLEPSFLMWAFHRHMRLDALTEKRVTVLFEFPERRANERRWWLIIDKGEVDLCLKRPGFNVDVTVTTDVQTLAMVYLGSVDPAEAQRSGTIAVTGRASLVRTFAKWCARSRFASASSHRESTDGKGPARSMRRS